MSSNPFTAFFKLSNCCEVFNTIIANKSWPDFMTDCLVGNVICAHVWLATWSSRCSMLRLGVPKVQSSKVPSSNVQSSKVPIFQVPIFQVPKFQGPIGKFQRSKFQSSKVPRFKEFSTRTTSLFHYVTGRHYAKSAFLPSSKVPTFQVPKFQVPSFSLRGEKAEEG